MNRKFLLIGALLIVLSIIGFSLSISSLSSQIVFLYANEMSLKQNTSQYFPVTVNTPSQLVLAYETNNTNTLVNAYIMNLSAFDTMAPYLNETHNLSNVANSLEGKGLIAEMLNQSIGGFPYFMGENTTVVPKIPEPQYIDPSYNLSVFTNGTYYLVYSNDKPYSITMEQEAYLRPLDKISSSNYIGGIPVVQSLLLTLVFISGIAIVIYSFMMKGNDKEAKLTDEQAHKIYNQMGRSQKKPAKKVSKKKRKKSSR